MARASVTSLTRLGAELASREAVPIMSKDRDEARRHVLSLYKQFQRNIPDYWHDYEFYDIPLPEFRVMIKNEFLRNSHLTDIRVIDRLVYQGKMDVLAMDKNYYNYDHVRNYLNRENVEQKGTDFLSRFLSGKD